MSLLISPQIFNYRSGATRKETESKNRVRGTKRTNLLQLDRETEMSKSASHRLREFAFRLQRVRRWNSRNLRPTLLRSTKLWTMRMAANNYHKRCVLKHSKLKSFSPATTSNDKCTSLSTAQIRRVALFRESHLSRHHITLQMGFGSQGRLSRKPSLHSLSLFWSFLLKAFGLTAICFGVRWKDHNKRGQKRELLR